MVKLYTKKKLVENMLVSICIRIIYSPKIPMWVIKYHKYEILDFVIKSIKTNRSFNIIHTLQNRFAYGYACVSLSLEITLDRLVEPKHALDHNGNNSKVCTRKNTSVWYTISWSKYPLRGSSNHRSAPNTKPGLVVLQRECSRVAFAKVGGEV